MAFLRCRGAAWTVSSVGRSPTGWNQKVCFITHFKHYLMLSFSRCVNIKDDFFSSLWISESHGYSTWIPRDLQIPVLWFCVAAAQRAVEQRRKGQQGGNLSVLCVSKIYRNVETILRMSHSSPVSIIHCAGQDGLLILGQGWFCGHLLKKNNSASKCKALKSLFTVGLRMDSKPDKSVMGGWHLDFVPCDVSPIRFIAATIKSNCFRFHMEPLVPVDSVSLMSASGGPLATERVKWKRFIITKTRRWVNTEAPACLTEGLSLGTLQGLEVRLWAPNCGICTQSAALLLKILCSSFPDKPCPADPSRVWENVSDLCPSLNILV